MMPGMRKRSRSWFSTIAVLALHVVAIAVIGPTLMFIVFVVLPEVVAWLWNSTLAAVLGIPLGALLIWKIAHWANRLDDPRRNRRPPNAP
jgi:membrane protein implicated in regulation of membrane protease activity